MSEHPLSSITKSHITNGLRGTGNKRMGSFRTDNLYGGIGLCFDNNEDEIRYGRLMLAVEEIGGDIIFRSTHNFKERHVEERMLREGEFRLKLDAIESFADKFISDIQRAISESKEQ